MRVDIKDYPNLTYLVHAYFHQDWMLDYETAEDVVLEFLIQGSDKFIQSVIAELSFIIDLHSTEEEYKKFLYTIEYCNLPEAYGMTNLEGIHWLYSTLVENYPRRVFLKQEIKRVPHI
jgi:hypothetical protein